MTHSKQAAKRVRQNINARERNRAVRTNIKSTVRKIVSQPTAEAGSLAASQSVVDKAVKAGVIHKNTAARRKSRMMRALNRAAAEKK